MLVSFPVVHLSLSLSRSPTGSHPAITFPVLFYPRPVILHLDWKRPLGSWFDQQSRTRSALMNWSLLQILQIWQHQLPLLSLSFVKCFLMKSMGEREINDLLLSRWYWESTQGGGSRILIELFRGGWLEVSLAQLEQSLTTNYFNSISYLLSKHFRGEWKVSRAGRRHHNDVHLERKMLQ